MTEREREKKKRANDDITYSQARSATCFFLVFRRGQMRAVEKGSPVELNRIELSWSWSRRREKRAEDAAQRRTENFN